MEEDCQIDRSAIIANILGPALDLLVMESVDNRRQIGIEWRHSMRAEHPELKRDPGARMLCRELVCPGCIKQVMDILRAPNDGKLRAELSLQHGRSIR